MSDNQRTRPSEAIVKGPEFFDQLREYFDVAPVHPAHRELEAEAIRLRGANVALQEQLALAALSTPPLPSAEPVAADDADYTDAAFERIEDYLRGGFPVPPSDVRWLMRRAHTTPPAAAQDTARLDWLEESGLVLSCQDSEQQDGSEVMFWMVGPDLDGSNGCGFGKTARVAIDNAMEANRAS